MGLFITLTRRKLFIIFLIIVLSLSIIVKVSSVGTNMPDGSTNQKRVLYLKSKGISAEDSDVFSKEITIPEEFTSVYNNYNVLQKTAGFDLSDYKGKNATLYTYPVYGTTEVHLIVYNGVIIGGDIADTRYGEKMKPLDNKKGK